jgi:hypothetical protein
MREREKERDRERQRRVKTKRSKQRRDRSGQMLTWESEICDSIRIKEIVVHSLVHDLNLLSNSSRGDKCVLLPFRWDPNFINIVQMTNPVNGSEDKREERQRERERQRGRQREGVRDRYDQERRTMVKAAHQSHTYISR